MDLTPDLQTDNFSGQKANMQMPATRAVDYDSGALVYMDDQTDVGIVPEVPRAIQVTGAGDLVGWLADESPFPFVTSEGIETEMDTGRANNRYKQSPSYLSGLLAGVIYPYRIRAIDTANSSVSFVMLY